MDVVNREKRKSRERSTEKNNRRKGLQKNNWKKQNFSRLLDLRRLVSAGASEVRSYFLNVPMDFFYE